MSPATTVLTLINSGAKQLIDAKVGFGHGTANAFDELDLAPDIRVQT